MQTGGHFVPVLMGSSGNDTIVGIIIAWHLPVLKFAIWHGLMIKPHSSESMLLLIYGICQMSV